MNFRDIELLSAYLDGRLKPSDAARLESRLSSDPDLRASLEDLRQTRRLLRRLPQRRAPRDFRLTPKMVGVRPPEPRSYPLFRFATALAAFLFVAAVALNALTPFAASHLAAAPAPAYGIGGGGGGYGGSGQFTEVPPQAAVPAPTEVPTLQAFTQLMATPTPEGTLSTAQATEQAQEDTSRAATELANKAAPLGATASAPESQSPIPLPLVVALGVLMLAFALAAWVMRRNNERRIRGQWNHK